MVFKFICAMGSVVYEWLTKNAIKLNMVQYEIYRDDKYGECSYTQLKDT